MLTPQVFKKCSETLETQPALWWWWWWLCTHSKTFCSLLMGVFTVIGHLTVSFSIKLNPLG